jgi:hypothetical protein
LRGYREQFRLVISCLADRNEQVEKVVSLRCVLRTNIVGPAVMVVQEVENRPNFSWTRPDQMIHIE